MRLRILGLWTLAIALWIVAPVVASPLKFSLPIDGQMGKAWFIQLYSDRDPSSGASDWGCGRLTYDQHKGTDFAIAHLGAKVKVLAAAPGKVLRTRDGVTDRPVRDLNDPQIKGQECGNGVVIDHGKGWESQYCHLRQGSVEVKPGDLVSRGTVLGLVGQSGLASFPHVHFEVRHQNQVIDPFMGDRPGNACQSQPQSLWQQPLAYVPTGLIDAGFSDRTPSLELAEQGELNQAQFSSQAPSLVFWVRVFGVLAEDQESWRILRPDLTVDSDRQQRISRSSKTWFSYLGKNNRQTLPPGTWTGEYSLRRGERTIISLKRTVTIQN
ncbi:MAG: M23 family metallopeptidase [Pseudanabaenaceae cyanobacterium bins.68]|nr:M23 family metallopeptidase [Pseudanabaenaceae cyanobacterium bins.68]